MKKLLAFCMLLICLPAFSQQKIGPYVNRWGFIGTLSTLADYTTEMDLFSNPGVGVGLRYHVSDFFLLEALVNGGYQTNNYSDGSGANRLHIGGGIGAFFWINTAADFSLFFGPQLLVYSVNVTHSSTGTLKIMGSILCGAQYSFSKHFAVFGRFGIGIDFFRNTNESAEADSLTYIRIVAPAIGFAFYL